MLDRMTPGEFDGWLAYWKIEPDPARELWRIREILKEGFAALCTAWGAKVEPAAFDPVQEEQQDEQGAPVAREEYVSPEQGAALFSTFAGSPAQRT